MVQRPDVLLTHALDDKDDHVLTRMALLVDNRMQMNRAIKSFHLLARHIAWRDKGSLAQAAYHRERRVQHDRGLNWAVDKLVGVADGDGTSARRDTAADAHNGQRYHHQQGCRLRDIVVRAEAIGLKPRFGIAAPQDGNQRDKGQHQVPVAQELSQDDGRDVALVGKLGEDRHRRAPTRVLEIDSIHQVHGDADGIGNDK